MGVTRQYIYKLVKENKLRASRISGRKSMIRRADIELMLKTKPYERIRPKDDFDITEYYTAEQVAERYKVSTKWYSKRHIDAAFAKYDVDNDFTEWYTPEEIQEKYGMTRVAIRSQVYPQQYPLKEGTRTNLLLQAPLRPLQVHRTGKLGRVLYGKGGNGEIQTDKGFRLWHPAIPRNQA